MKAYKIFGVLCLIILVVSILPVSRLAIAPKDVSVDGDMVSVVRSFPGDALHLMRPRISYVETVTPLTPSTNDGHFCEDKGGPTRYSRSTKVGRWRIPWAAPCLADPVGYTWEACWSWHIGAFKFGATCLIRTFLKEGE